MTLKDTLVRDTLARSMLLAFFRSRQPSPEEVKAVTAAVKAEIGRQLNARPMPHAEQLGTGDWSATGHDPTTWATDNSTLDLSLVARAALKAQAAHIAKELEGGTP